MWDDVFQEVANRLPPFNDFLLTEFREREIARCPDFMESVFQEMTKLLADHTREQDPTSDVITYVGKQVLDPEQRIAVMQESGKVVADILQTELMLVEYRFEFQQRIYTTRVHLPYLYPGNKAIIINGTKYFLQLPLTDKTFYYITKEGIGIKVMRSPLHFWRNIKTVMNSIRGRSYPEDIITTKIHQRNIKYTKEDLRTPLLLYILIERGWYGTLDTFDIAHEHLQFVTEVGIEPDYEYFKIRSDRTPDNTLTSTQLQRSIDTGPGLYLRVHRSLLEIPIDQPKTKSRVVASILYTMQYFVRTKSTMYENTQTLIDLLKNQNVVWKIILGKTIYGMKLERETQALNHADAHLSSLRTYLDPHTEGKLQQIGIDCKDIFDLLIYVFVNIDRHIVNRSPSNLYDKRINITDMLLGGIVKNIFLKVYGHIRKKRPLTTREVESLLRVGFREIHKIYDLAVVRPNPAIYNDNMLLAVAAKRIRTSHSGSPSNKQGSKPQRRRLLTAEEHRFHPSFVYVESITNIPSSNPGNAGSINTYCEIDMEGGVIHAEHANEVDVLARYFSNA